MKFSKLMVALSLLGLSSPTLAAMNLHNWGFKVGGIYNRFSNNGTNFAYSYSEVDNDFMIPPDEVDRYKYYNINNTFALNYFVGVSYLLDWKDTRVDFLYTHLHNTDTRRAGGADTEFWLVPWDGEEGRDIRGKADYGYDNFQLTFGHTLKLTPTFDMTYYGGLDYLHFRRDMNSNLWGDGEDTQSYESGTSFKGFGPVFGLMGTCHPGWDPHFSVDGGVEAAMLYGDMHGYGRNRFDDYAEDEQFPSAKTTVPLVSSSINLNYDIPMAGWNFRTSFGYQVAQIFNATKDNSYYDGGETSAGFQAFTLSFGAQF